MGAITLGLPAIARAGDLDEGGGDTWLVKDNPANADGFISSVAVWFDPAKATPDHVCLATMLPDPYPQYLLIDACWIGDSPYSIPTGHQILTDFRDITTGLPKKLVVKKNCVIALYWHAGALMYDTVGFGGIMYCSGNVPASSGGHTAFSNGYATSGASLGGSGATAPAHKGGIDLISLFGLRL